MIITSQSYINLQLHSFGHADKTLHTYRSIINIHKSYIYIIYASVSL